jgi:hypothetical protein
LLFGLPKLLQTSLGDLLHQPPGLLIGAYPLVGKTFQGLGHMDHLPLRTDPKRKIETGVQLATGTFASGFAAEARHGDQGTDEERFFVEELREAGAGLAFLWGQVGTVAHRDLLSYLIYIIISDMKSYCQAFYECEFAPYREFTSSV